MVFFFCFFFCSFFFKISFSLQKEEDVLKKKNKLDQVLTQKKANLGPGFDSTAYIYGIYIYIWHAYIYIYIYIYAVVFNFGAFFPMGSRMHRFFLNMERIRMTKKRFFPRWQVGNFQNMCTKMSTPSRTSNAFKNGGAYVAQHKHPIIERVHAAHSWTFQFPMFSPFSSTQKSLKPPPFLQRFMTISGVFWGPPNRAPLYIQVTTR